MVFAYLVRPLIYGIWGILFYGDRRYLPLSSTFQPLTPLFNYSFFFTVSSKTLFAVFGILYMSLTS